MDGKQLLKYLKCGKVIYGTAIVSPSPMWPVAVQQAGLDFVFLDTEHTPIDRLTLAWMCQIYRAVNLAPIVRIPLPDPFEACKVLDGGATGIIAPYVESAEQVKILVGATKLRPLKGKRLDAILNNNDLLEPLLHQYLDNRNADTVLIINIESVPAMEKLDDIFTVPGLDGIIIGPHDLSCSLGIPEQYRHPTFEHAMHMIITKARNNGLAVGVHFSEEPDLQIKWAKAGINIILHSSDISLFSQTLQNHLSQIRMAIGDKPVKQDSSIDTTI